MIIGLGRDILGRMDINWLGHSCFRLRGRQAVVITDPFPPDLGYTLSKTTADIVTVSHQHAGHSYHEGIGGDPKVIAGPGEYEIQGVLIIGIATFHDADRGQRRGKNTAYLIEIDGITVCHLGDLGHILTTEQVEEVADVDVLLLPVGGGSTINAATAAEVIRQIEPRAVIPMHYQTPVLKRELEPVDSFLKEMGIERPASQAKISFNQSSLPTNTQVFLLDY